MGRLGMPEIAVIAAILLILFGPAQIPKFGRSIGATICEFRKAGKELKSLHEDPDADND